MLNEFRAVAVMLAGLAGSAVSAGTIEGSVTYLDRMAVPPGATLDVSLLDVSRQDVAATQIASDTYDLDRVPFPFLLPFEDAQIDQAMTYSVAAKITHNGKILYRSTSAYPVLTRGADHKVDITVERMQDAAVKPDIWTVTDLRGRVLISDRLPTVEFGPGGKIGGTSGCNRYFGKIEMGAKDLSFDEAIGATRMACAPPYDKLERDFFDALPEITGYVLNGDQMAFVNAAGVTVMRLARGEKP